jgi:hypothetical protein
MSAPLYLAWPMEQALTPAALAAVEDAIREHAAGAGCMLPPSVLVELENCANDIRSLLQHYVAERVQARKADAEDPLLS